MIDYIETMNDLKSFDKEELIDVISAYSNYVVEFYEEHDEGSQPASFKEFLEIDYPMIYKDDLSFIDDTEKMVDFITISKEEFLDSYEYLSEMEYDATMYVFNEDKADVLATLMRGAENLYIEEMNGRDDEEGYLTSEGIKTAVSDYLPKLTDKERQDFEDYCSDMAV